jgi:hypothetical protein
MKFRELQDSGEVAKYKINENKKLDIIQGPCRLEEDGTGKWKSWRIHN